MDYKEYIKPQLVETGVKYFLHETLKQCHHFKASYQNLLVNIGLFLCFIFILICILFFKYKGKPTPEEKHQKEQVKQQYILSKINQFQKSKREEQQTLINGLPHWENEFENVNVNKIIY